MRSLKITGFIGGAFILAAGLLLSGQVQVPGVLQHGAVTAGHCTTWFGTNQIQDSGAAGCGGSPANPTATAGPTAINGSASTYMRSDAAPAVQKGSNAQFGIVEGDGTTITCVIGVCSLVTATPTGANPTATAGPAAVNGSSLQFMRADAAPAVQVGSSSQEGILQGDGSTLTITAGTIKCTTASASQIGCSEPDNSTIKISSNQYVAQSLTFGGQSVAPGASATMQGTGAKIQASTGSTTTNDCVKFDANGNTVDLGGACPTYTAGTWTPTLTTTGTAGTPAYTIQSGSYEQIGRQVTIRFFIVISGWTGSPSGTVEIAGLPFTSANTSNDFGVCYYTEYVVTGLAASNFGMGGYITPNTAVAVVLQNGSTSAMGVSAAQFGTANGNQILGFCTYHT